MKAFIFVAAASLALSASVASAAPRKHARADQSPQVTAHEQTTRRDAGEGFWSKKATYKPHWRNHYTN